MIKFSKFFAVMLTVCLLFGSITAILVSADGDVATATGGDVIRTTLSGRAEANAKLKPFGDVKPTYPVFAAYDYITIDLDFAIPEGYDAYPQKLYIQNAGMANIFVTKNKDDGLYYLSDSATTPIVEPERQISATPGVYNHLTLIFQYDVTAATMHLHVYLNGKFVKTYDSAVAASTKTDSFQIRCVSAGNWTGYALDYRITGCTYDNDSAKSTALANVIASGNPLYSYEEGTDEFNALIYNAYYHLPGQDYLFKVNGKKIYHPDVAENALSSIKNGTVLEPNTDIVDFDVPDGVENFTLIYNPEETLFTLCEEDAENIFIVKNTKNNYTVRVATEADTLMLKRVVKYGEKEIVVSSSEIMFLRTPETNVTFSAFNFNDLKLYTGVATDWIVDVDGDVPETINLYDPEQIRPVSDAEAALLREEFDGILTTTAIVEEGSVTVTDFSSGYAYIAGYVNNGVFTPKLDSNGRYESYKDIATLDAEKATWDEDVVYYEIVDGEASLPQGSAAQAANAIWNVPSNQLTGTNENTGSQGVTNLVKNSFKDNGTVDGYGILIIR